MGFLNHFRPVYDAWIRLRVAGYSTPPDTAHGCPSDTGFQHGNRWVSTWSGGQVTLNSYPCDQGLTACTNNNGNIWRETIQSKGITGMDTQEYRYDTLNRLRWRWRIPQGR